jgi:hypothetical protein
MTMRALDAADVLEIWDEARGQGPIERALTVLAVACPDDEREMLASLSLGARDARLLTIRRQMFGSTLDACVACPHCRERLEFSLDLSTVGQPATPGDRFFMADGVTVRFRLPHSGDLLAASFCASSEQAHALLVERCVEEARRGPAAVSCAELSDIVLTELAARIETADPEAEISLDLDCPACAARWTAVLDVPAFLWNELRCEAQCVLREVHALASAYGWREADILALSGARRAQYLEMLG